MIKKFFLYFCLLTYFLIGFSLDARRFEHQRCRPRSSGPRMSFSYGVHYPLYATYPYRDQWSRYRPYRYYGSDYPYYSVGYDSSYRDDRDDREYYEKKKNRVVDQLYVNEKEYQGISLICIELPSLDRSFYEINGRSYASLYALYAALRLQKYEVTSATRTVAQLKESKGRFYHEAESLGVMHSGLFKDFTRKAFPIIKKMRKNDPSMKKMRGSITSCTKEDLSYLVSILHEKVVVGYDSFAGRIDSLNQLLEEEIPALKEKESKVFCLPLSRNSKEWAAIKLEKKGGIVYGVMIKVY